MTKRMLAVTTGLILLAYHSVYGQATAAKDKALAFEVASIRRDTSQKTRHCLHARSAIADGETSIFTSVQEQLGLRLDASKGSVETLLIDHLERPSEN